MTFTIYIGYDDKSKEKAKKKSDKYVKQGYTLTEFKGVFELKIKQK